MSAEIEIYSALTTRLDAMPSAPPIAYINARYEPEIGALYLKEIFSLNIKEPIGYADNTTNDYEGIYRIVVYSPAEKGTFDGMNRASEISDFFARGLVLNFGSVNVEITKSMVGTGVNDGDWYMIPVSVYWKCLS